MPLKAANAKPVVMAVVKGLAPGVAAPLTREKAIPEPKDADILRSRVGSRREGATARP